MKKLLVILLIGLTSLNGFPQDTVYWGDHIRKECNVVISK